MSKTRIYEWYKRFQDGRENVEDDERPGRPSTSTTDEKREKSERNGYERSPNHNQRSR
uniref:Mos1 transposase HTH domain-containing protein n=1 Tax=Rhodnius prolixus TaxID=13249 RepID=T1HJ97_RHOPR